jgi:hypothetical protein
MSFHFSDFMTLLNAVSAAVHTVEQIMPASAGAAKLDAAIQLVQATAPALKQTADELKPVVNVVVAAAKSVGGTLNSTPVNPIDAALSGVKV